MMKELMHDPIFLVGEARGRNESELGEKYV